MAKPFASIETRLAKPFASIETRLAKPSAVPRTNGQPRVSA